MQIALRKLIVLMLLSIIFFGLTPVQASLIINEVMYNPSAVSDTNGEWFEIYNSGASLDLQGYLFSDDSGSFSVPSSLIIPASGYLVFARKGDPAVNGGVPADFTYGAALYFGNSGDTLSIEDPTSLLVDTMTYGTGTGFPSATGASICFTGLGDNGNGANWINSLDLGMTYGAGDYGTPGSANVSAVPEPASMLLIGSGLAGIFLSKRKKTFSE